MPIGNNSAAQQLYQQLHITTQTNKLTKLQSNRTYTISLKHKAPTAPIAHGAAEVYGPCLGGASIPHGRNEFYY